MIKNRVWLLTGPRGCGKTTFCKQAVSCAKEAGWSVSGIISPASDSDGVRTAIHAEDLKSGDVQPLAALTQIPGHDLLLGKWYLNRATLEWGNRLLKTNLPSDLFIIDELGPLEFLRGEGWTSGLEQLQKKEHRVGLLVIRPELLEAALSILPDAEIIHLEPGCDPDAAALQWWRGRAGDG